MKPQNNPELEAQAEELAALLDALMESGSEHINLEVGEQTRVRTVNSTDCSGNPGACAMPTFQDEDEEAETNDDDEEW